MVALKFTIISLFLVFKNASNVIYGLHNDEWAYEGTDYLLKPRTLTKEKRDVTLGKYITTEFDLSCLRVLLYKRNRNHSFYIF